MFDFQVDSPIVNSPYQAPHQHWHMEEGTPPQLAAERRKPIYHYRSPKHDAAQLGMDEDVGYQIELLTGEPLP